MGLVENINLRIMVYHLIIIGVSLITPLALYLRSDQDPRLWWMTVMHVSLIPFYVINVTVLIPKFLNKRRYVLYFGLLLISLLLAYILLTLLFHKYGLPPLNDVNKLPREFMENKLQPPFILFPLIVYYALGISFETIIESEKQKRLNEESLKEKVNTELSFLKSQINPHFLFNSLNSIYSLSNSKSELTKDAVLLLSDMMRYMLHESNGGRVPLNKEINYIENFIALQRLRIANKSNISIRFNCNGEHNGHLVEPLLFIPFIENAFKHGISYSETSIINIKLKIFHDKLIFETLNSQPSNKEYCTIKTKNEPYGIGLSNIARRLDLLYPKKYKLKYNKRNDLFSAKLELDLV